MRKKTDIWMPLYIADYLADTSHLSTEQSGAYLHLLMHYWRTGPLPNDDNQLGQITKLRERWAENKDVIKEFFYVGEDGRLHQGRSDKEIGAAGDRLSKGASGGRSRWDSPDPNKLNRSERLAAARKIATHTVEEWLQLKAFCRHLCMRCNAFNEELVKDHIVPIYQGGSDGISNIQPLCRKCNASKGPESKDYRPDDWQNAFKTPSKGLPNAYSSPSHTPSPSSSPTQEKQKPSRAKRSGDAAKDPRHMPFKASLALYWEHKNTTKMPWDGRQAAALNKFLAANPELSLSGFQDLLRNRVRSEDVAHGAPVSEWIGGLTRYSEPLDRFGRPKGKTNGHKPSAATQRAEQIGQAISQAIFDNGDDGTGGAGASFGSGGDPAAAFIDGQRREQSAGGFGTEGTRELVHGRVVVQKH